MTRGIKKERIYQYGFAFEGSINVTIPKKNIVNSMTLEKILVGIAEEERI